MSQEIKMDTIILYHGSPNKIVTPIFGGGDDKHDYGRGFYLTENIDLADAYDVIKGWRANASYFYIAKEFVRDNIDIDILEELLSLGGLGIQYCIKTEKAYANLREIESDLLQVEYNEFNNKYNQRDIEARKKMRNLVDSDANKVTNVFSTLF